MSPKRENAVRRALKRAPGTLRALAREAGVSLRLLQLIRDGERSATPEVVAALAHALERLAKQNAEAARVLRQALMSTDKGKR